MSASIDLSKFLEGIKRANAAAQASAVRAMNRHGQAVLTNARQRAPVHTGDLKRSGTAMPATMEGGVLSKTIGFNMEYATYVHERLDLHHSKGEAKFLENALREMQFELAPYIQDEMKKDGF